MSSHPSERPTWTSAGSLQAVLSGLASGGVCPAAASPRRWCALTAPFHPCPPAVHVGRPVSAVCFCGTFPRVSPGRLRPPCPVMSRLSSKTSLGLRGCLTRAFNLARPVPVVKVRRRTSRRPTLAGLFEPRRVFLSAAAPQRSCVPQSSQSPCGAPGASALEVSSPASAREAVTPPQDVIFPPHTGQRTTSPTLSSSHTPAIRSSNVRTPGASPRTADSTPLGASPQTADSAPPAWRPTLSSRLCVGRCAPGRSWSTCLRTSRPGRPGRPGRPRRLRRGRTAAPIRGSSAVRPRAPEP